MKIITKRYIFIRINFLPLFFSFILLSSCSNRVQKLPQKIDSFVLKFESDYTHFDKQEREKRSEAFNHSQDSVKVLKDELKVFDNISPGYISGFKEIIDKEAPRLDSLIKDIVASDQFKDIINSLSSLVKKINIDLSLIKTKLTDSSEIYIQKFLELDTLDLMPLVKNN